MRRSVMALALVGSFAATLPAAEMAQVGDIRIHDAWARASLGATPNSAAYMTLETLGAEPDRLISGSSPAAEALQLHTHTMEDGIARMRQVEAVEVVPGTPTVLEPGGLHVMLIGLNGRLEEGATASLTLVFENAGEITLEVPVRGMAGGPRHGGHGNMRDNDARTN